MKKTVTHLSLRNIYIDGKRTSIRLENNMWDALKEIADRESTTVSEVCTMLSKIGRSTTLTATIRSFTLLYFKAAATEEGHVKAGHGAFGDILARKEKIQESYPETFR